jgi:hypothetical protein
MAMTSDQSAALMSQPQFRGRVQVCCIKYSDSIRSANSSAIGHVSLERWADSVYNQPTQVASQVQPFVVMDPAVQTAGVDAEGLSLVGDVELQGAVEATVNKTI